jgi:hypothetical protein
MKPDKIYYGFFWEHDGQENLEFLTSTQKCMSLNFDKVKKEAEESIKEYMYSVDPPYTREEAEDDLGKPIFVEIRRMY